jgi:hypothetical protein
MRALPPGYVALDLPEARVVAHHRLADGVREAMRAGTLHAWAGSHPQRRELHGRVTAWSAPLPGDGARVVVRHSHRGGLLAPLLRDLFPPPTRAPLELELSLLLRQSGVPTPPVAAYAIYRAGPLLRRADVATIELPGEDLVAVLRRAQPADVRRTLVGVVGALLGALTQAGAWHPDLNVKNIFLVNDGDAPPQAAVLDVDRVTFVPPCDPNLREANFRRLARSMRKWRGREGIGFTEAELAELHELLTRDEATLAAHRAVAIGEQTP